ncbi:DUF2732 family protein [Buttiauxella sp. 3AFRM03]|uniref:DUF2732 family protein n=1 Tax=Buttiauxella sp. 3AFRM03 TaxID=2479367 RepID=UPI000EF75A52|nr:DUF2732 family protein [Buttiauxella sp. 3AFRM03]AYN29694.1 DUF2732 family protein [Buttiauxella sp. 3AFRM03]
MAVRINHQRNTEQLNSLLTQARAEGKADAAVKYSSHIDGLIRHITNNELSGVEIVELLHQESRKLHESGLSYQQGAGL